MSENKQDTLKYHERLNISVLSIAKVKKLIRNDIIDTIAAWNKSRNMDKQCYHIIGPAGVGKTQICFQLADELTNEIFGEFNKKNPKNPKTFNCLMVKSPVLSRDR
jgi:ATP-dependent Lon protease